MERVKNISSTLHAAGTAQKYCYMCSPTYYKISYAINPWMKNQIVDDTLKYKQWTNLYDTINSMGINIQLIPSKNCPDMVFTADSGLLLNNKFFTSNYKHKQRMPERVHWINYFQSKRINVINLPSKYTFEGSGDIYLTNKQMYFGHGQRSTLETAYYLSDMLELKVVPLELTCPYFFHLDTCFYPLDEYNAVLYPNAFSKKTLRTLGNYFNIFSVNQKEAHNFACNMIKIGTNNIIMPTNCPLVKNYLNSKNYNVYEIDISEYIKAGGGIKCLTLFHQPV